MCTSLIIGSIILYMVVQLFVSSSRVFSLLIDLISSDSSTVVSSIPFAISHIQAPFFPNLSTRVTFGFSTISCIVFIPNFLSS